MMPRVENDRRFSLGHARITIAGLQAPGDAGFQIMREGYAAASLGRREPGGNPPGRTQHCSGCRPQDHTAS
jgi:hypothetical protein